MLTKSSESQGFIIFTLQISGDLSIFFGEEGNFAVAEYMETNRDIGRQLTRLVLPLLVGNIFQQFYNIISTLIVGRAIGESAFAALGIAGSVMNLYIFILNGVCVGISVLLARLYGGGDLAYFRRGIFVSASAGAVFTLALSVASILSLPTVLRLIQTPVELQPLIEQYLDVILAGLIATFLYNLCAAILRSVGNTRSALLFLIIAVFCNAALTLILVAYLHLGLSGAGYATVFSQLLSAFLCWKYIKKRMPILLVGRDDMRYDGALLRRMAQYASISALHQSSLYIGKIFVQGAVNSLGTASIAAYTAAERIEGIANAFGTSGSEAVSIYVAHKGGAGDLALAKRGLSVGLFLLLILGAASSLAMFLFAGPCVGVFMGSKGFTLVSLQEGVGYLRAMSVFYVLSFIGNAFVGYFRGSGKFNIPLIGTTIQITLRVIFSYTLASRFGLNAVAVATCIGWGAIVAFQICVYRSMSRKEKLEVATGLRPRKPIS